MRKRGRSSAGRWALGALLVVALVGVAWADSQSIAVSPGATVVAVVVPGPDGGGQVFGDEPGRGDENVQFNVGGQIEVNGEISVAYDPDDEYTCTLQFYEDSGQWYVDTLIENGEGLVFMQVAHLLDRPPVMITAAGERVVLLHADE